MMLSDQLREENTPKFVSRQVETYEVHLQLKNKITIREIVSYKSRAC